MKIFRPESEEAITTYVSRPPPCVARCEARSEKLEEPTDDEPRRLRVSSALRPLPSPCADERPSAAPSRRRAASTSPSPTRHRARPEQDDDLRGVDLLVVLDDPLDALLGRARDAVGQQFR